MRIVIAEACIWLLLWFGLSLAFGIYTGGHAWQIIPVIGAIYGISAGIIYSIASYLYRKKRGQVSILVASLVGLLASMSTVPVLVAEFFPLGFTVLFAAFAGPITGVIVHLFVRGFSSHETNL